MSGVFAFVEGNAIFDNFIYKNLRLIKRLSYTEFHGEPQRTTEKRVLNSV